MKKELGGRGDELTTSVCAPPEWQRGPIRVSFGAANKQKLVYSLQAHSIDLTHEVEDEDNGE
jgi:hypothetical protein